MSGNFAATLKAARKKKRLTMIAVSELTGIATPIYKMIEAGKIFPDSGKLKAICEVLEFPWLDDDDDE